MKTLRESIALYYPKEHILHEYPVDIEVLQNKFGVIPYGSFKPKNIVTPKSTVIETTNFWFVDKRMKLRDGRDYILTTAEKMTGSTPDYQKINLFLIPLFVVLLLWYVIGIWSILTGAIILFLQFLYLATQRRYFDEGLLVAMYEKSWIKDSKKGNILELDIKMPKYAKDTIWKHRMNSRLLDFIGITISSAPLTFHYTFKLLSSSNSN